MVRSSNPARPFGSIVTAMVTPFTPNGEVDYDAAARLATWLVDQGSDGIVVNGTTGESSTTYSPEKIELIKAVVKAVGDRATITAGAGSNDTRHAARMARQAAEAGTDGILIVTPYYSRPSQKGVARHIIEVAEAGGLPAMVYDVPGRTGVRIAPETFDELAKHPLIVGAKDATGDVAAAAGHAARTGLAWYSGDDGLLLPFLSHGGAGIVSVASHAVPSHFAEVIKRWDAGDHAGALEVFRTTIPVIKALNGAGMQAVMAKAAVEALGLTPNREVRAPLVTADEEEAAAVVEALRGAGLLDDAGKRVESPKLVG